MKYSKLTNKSNIFLKRFTHTSRHIHCSKLVRRLKYKTYLDYGTGDGQLFEFIKIKKKSKYYAYEPYKKMYQQFINNKKKLSHVKLIKKEEDLRKKYYDIISINEVIEHLPPKKIIKLFKIIKSITKKNSFIIISVPIEIGLSSLVKNLIRLLFNSKHEGLNLNNLIRSIFQKKIYRGKGNYYKSHIGFNHLDLKQNLEIHFSIINISYSPFNILKNFLNSQIFFVCRV